LESTMASERDFKLAQRHEVIPAWPRRGLPEHLGPDAESVIRCSAGEDRTNGFFVSLFVKETARASHLVPTSGTSTKRKGDEETQAHKKKRRKKGKVDP